MNKCQTILVHETASMGAGTCNPIPKEAEQEHPYYKDSHVPYQESVSKKFLNQVPEAHISHPGS
jgi:hypothetical protein